MDVSDLSSSSIEYDSGNTDEEELDFTSANENAPPEDEHTSGDDDVDESMDADGIDLEDDNVEQEEDVDTDNIQSDVVDEPNDDEKLDSSFVDETKAFYADLISKKMEYDNVPDRRTNSLNTDGNKVGDPAKVAARGAPKKRKRRDDGEGPVTKNGRPLSYDERGKGIRCSRCKKPEHTKRSLKCELHPRHVAHVFVGQEDQ
ncbi:hypothetical protein ACQ4PT_001873 [Festuca glaucescens]